MNTRILAAALVAACPLAAFAQNAAPTPPAVIAAPTAQAVTLRYKFAPGQTRRYKMTLTMNTTMLTGQSGAGIPMNMIMAMTMRQTVKDVRQSDGAATIEAQLETVKMSMNGKDMTMPAAQQAIMTKPYTSVMLPTGKVLSFQMPAMPSGGVPGMDFSKGMSAASVAFPDAPVKIGDVWNGTVAAGMAGMKMIITSALADVDTTNGGDLATIKQTINGDINMTLSKGMPVTMKMTGKMTGSGAQVFDVSAGAIAKQNLVMDVAFLMRFTPPAGAATPSGMPQTMKMAMKESMTMQRLDDSVPALAPVQ